jgi:hypothetical protein
MRSFGVSVSVFVALLAFALPAGAQSAQNAQAGPISRSPRELGAVLLRELAVGDGKLVFRVDSNGCTDAGSFTVRVDKEEGVAVKAAHYHLTIERVRIDECKAMLWEGVVIELDLERDIGLKGTYTVSVTNPVAPKGGLGP